MPYISRVAEKKLASIKIFEKNYKTKDGTSIRDYIHVMLAYGHVAMLKNIKAKKDLSIYNLGTGKGLSVLDVLKVFEKNIGNHIPFKFTKRRKGDMLISLCSPRKAARDLNWTPKYNKVMFFLNYNIMSKYLIVGGGGFIGGHLVSRLLNENKKVRVVDIKPKNLWFQKFDKSENFSLDMQEYENCLKMTDGIDYVVNLACNMGGIGFIENNKAECMLSVLINTNLLRACKKNNIQKYFYSSSACVYNKNLQTDPNILGLKEEDAYPAMPEDGYGWEKLFSERMCKHFTEDYGLETRVARFHNIYGPLGTFDGGREKAPAAICRKVIEAKIKNSEHIDVWGDGTQTRSFLYIDDCIEAVLKLFESDYSSPINIGSDEKVSINELISIVENLAEKNFKRNYQLDKPQGVKGRSSNNDLIKATLNWNYSFSLKEGMSRTFDWINDIYLNKKNDELIRFTTKNLN